MAKFVVFVGALLVCAWVIAVVYAVGSALW
jgi:hypothetical protein